MALYGNATGGSLNAPSTSYAREFQSYLVSHPDMDADTAFKSFIKSHGAPSAQSMDEVYSIIEGFYADKRTSIYEGLESGGMTGSDALSQYGEYGLQNIDPALGDYINQKISEDNATTAYNREIEARDSSLTSTINQLTQAGMNPGSAISIGGSALGSVPQAGNTGISSAQLAQQRKINEYNQKQHMTRQLISMAGSIAAAGIGGGVYGLARGAAVKAARATVGSARSALQSRKIIKDRGHEDDPDSWYL